MITLKEVLANTLRSGTFSPNGGEDVPGDRLAVPQRQRVAAPAVPPGRMPERARGPVAAPHGEAFSTLALRDRVVIMLLFDQIVTEEQVAQVWGLWHQEYRGDLKTPLWRLLTLIPELDREMILAEAARVYDIEKITLSARALLPMLENLANHVPAPLWERMMALRLLPVTEIAQRFSHRKQLVFVSHDPTHPEVKQLLDELGVEAFVLRYAPEHEIVGIMAQAFPAKYGALKKEVDRERARVARKRQSPGDASQAGAPHEAAGPRTVSGDPPLNTSSIITFFEELLVGVVRSGASGVCLVPASDETTEVYTLVDNELNFWCVIERIAPPLLLATIKNSLLRPDLAFAQGAKQQGIERWIDGSLVRFRVSTIPFGQNLDRQGLLFRAAE